jgi:uncharacterized protein (DUF1501 family)
MDIWQTANPDDGTGPGWLGRWLDLAGPDPMRAISIGATLPIVLRGQSQSAIAITGPRIDLPGGPGVRPAYSALQTSGADRLAMQAVVAASGRDLIEVQRQLDDLPTSSAGGTGSAARSSTVAGQLQMVAELIKAGAPTKVYQVSLSSFDTHSDEKPTHEGLLSQLDKAVTGFFSALGSASNSPGRGCVVMTYSEFGRRPLENASGGTDHGAAAPLFVMGRTVRGGRFYGDEPSLTALDSNGNLLHTTDFRSVYATVLDRVIGADPAQVLGARFPLLDFV